MGPWGQFALNTANTAVGAGMGQLLARFNDERQMRMQERLQALQIKGQKEMQDYGFKNQLAMWKQTSFAGQAEEMRRAGLNIGLMYGMGGGGGATTGNASGNVTGGTAPSGGRETETLAGMGLQNAMSLALMKSQKDVLDSQAIKNKADAAATAGVNTDATRQSIEESKQRVENLMQGYDNMRQDYDIKLLEKKMMNMQNFEKQASQEDRMGQIKSDARIAANIVRSTAAEAKIDEATVNSKIETIQKQAIYAGLQNINMQAQTRKTDQEVSVMVNNIMREWDYLSNDNARIEIMKQLKDWETSETREAINQLTRLIPSLMDLRPRTHRSSTGTTREGNTTTTRSTHTHY